MPSSARTALRLATLALVLASAVAGTADAATAQEPSVAVSSSGAVATAQDTATPAGLPCPACWS